MRQLGPLLGLALLLSCSVGSSGRQLPQAKGTRAVKDGGEFDFFYLVRQWSGSFCSDHDCPMVHRHGYKFTIHGLWPNYATGGWPENCDANYKFDENKLLDLLPDLQEEWPSVFAEDESFWEHEWSKHGTCALESLHSEHDYFAGVLKLHWRNDLQAALEKSGIEPSLDRTYLKVDIEDAINAMYGVDALVHCKNGQLTEIWMCIDKDLRPYSCERPPVNPGKTDPCEHVLIPPLRPLPGPSNTNTQAAAVGQVAASSSNKGAGSSMFAARRIAASSIDAAGSSGADSISGSGVMASTDHVVRSSIVADDGSSSELLPLLAALHTHADKANTVEVQAGSEAGQAARSDHSDSTVPEAEEEDDDDDADEDDDDDDDEDDDEDEDDEDDDDDDDDDEEHEDHDRKHNHHHNSDDAGDDDNAEHDEDHAGDDDDEEARDAAAADEHSTAATAATAAWPDHHSHDHDHRDHGDHHGHASWSHDHHHSWHGSHSHDHDRHEDDGHKHSHEHDHQDDKHRHEHEHSDSSHSHDHSGSHGHEGSDMHVSHDHQVLELPQGLQRQQQRAAQAAQQQNEQSRGVLARHDLPRTNAATITNMQRLAAQLAAGAAADSEDNAHSTTTSITASGDQLVDGYVVVQEGGPTDANGAVGSGAVAAVAVDNGAATSGLASSTAAASAGDNGSAGADDTASTQPTHSSRCLIHHLLHKLSSFTFSSYTPGYLLLLWLCVCLVLKLCRSTRSCVFLARPDPLLPAGGQSLSGADAEAGGQGVWMNPLVLPAKRVPQ